MQRSNVSECYSVIRVVLDWIESFCVRRNDSNGNTIAVILVGNVNHKS